MNRQQDAISEHVNYFHMSISRVKCLEHLLIIGEINDKKMMSPKR